MAQNIMFSGGIPAQSAEGVFDLLASKIGDRAAFWPDGEVTSRRRGWIDAINNEVLAKAPCFEPTVDPSTGEPSFVVFKMLKIRDGVTVDLKGQLPYADEALETYKVFKRKKAEGSIPQVTRFQLPVPGAHNVIAISFPDVDAWPRLIEAWQEALQEEYRRILEVIPPAELCLQVDYCNEMVHIGGTGAKIYPWIPQGSHEELFACYTSTEYIQGHLKGLPDDVLIGFHICCGTKPSYPVHPLDTIRFPVDMANAIQRSSGGKVGYFHLPAMADSDEAYFAPLAGLDVGDAEIFLGLECNDGIEGMDRRMAAARKALPEFGVAHYCGYYWNEEIMPELLGTLVEGADHLERWSN